VAFALGLRHNLGQPRRFWRDWQSDGRTEPFGDGWMSKSCRVLLRAPHAGGRLVVAGRHHAQVRRPLVLTVAADGERVGRIAMRHNGEFERRFDVPARLHGRECEVEVVSAWTWRPGGRRGDDRRLSCLLDRVAFE
jgi:hypothetical protein